MPEDKIEGAASAPAAPDAPIDGAAPPPVTGLPPGSPTPDAPPVSATPAAPAAPVKRHVRRQAVVTTTDPVTEAKTVSAILSDTEADALPVSATLACPFGYYDDEGAGHWWHAGQTVTDAAEIADLADRGAIFAADA